VVEELVEAFQTARPTMLEFARGLEAIPASPKRKREPEQYYEDMERASKRPTRSSGRTRGSQQIVIKDSDEEDGDYVPGKY
jgi:hypothetical protein